MVEDVGWYVMKRPSLGHIFLNINGRGFHIKVTISIIKVIKNVKKIECKLMDEC